VGVSRFGFADNHIVQGNYERDARSDGSGALAVVDGRINAELAHPLASGDAQDVSFTPGQRIAICVRYVAADLTMGAMPTGCHLGEAQNYFELDLAATN
jgi:hypothetical protein